VVQALFSDTRLWVFLHALTIDHYVVERLLLCALEIDVSIILVLEESVIRPYTEGVQNYVRLWISMSVTNINRTYTL
jgi:hypothetical protein